MPLLKSLSYRLKGIRPNMVFINDISESKRHETLIRDFLDEAVGRYGLNWGRYKLVKASEIREKVLDHIKKDARKKGKYDLILTGDKGGTLLFSGRQLLELGKKVKRLRYSTHLGKDAYDKWPALALRELEGLGRKPRILLLESDVGPMGDTAEKMAQAREVIKGRIEGADMRLVAGITNKAALKKGRLDYTAYKTGAQPLRLTELLDILKSLAEVDMLPAVNQEKVKASMEKIRLLMAGRAMRTGTLPH